LRVVPRRLARRFGEIGLEIIEIVREVANGEQSDPLDDGLPGGR
jgi:hypothetical protein